LLSTLQRRLEWNFLQKSNIYGKFYIVSVIQIDINLSIRCLAHVINLATQALINAHSKVKHYNPATFNEHMLDADEMV